MSANKNYNLICKQIVEHKPNFFLINDAKVFLKVKSKFKKKKITILNKIDPKKKTINKSYITIAAIPGIAGLNLTLEMIKKSEKILIANKESIVCGWDLINKIALKNKTKIIPIDSEHFSIMKLLENQNPKNIKKIYLTASGGPFLNYDTSRLKNVKPKDAIKHPKWKMGKKISIDSATLMNKMLELIEAEKIFSIDQSMIEIVIHPQSLVHAIIELKNGLYKFIYHETTMIIPLANAILNENISITDFIKLDSKNKKNMFFKNLNFLKVDKKKFPIINLKNRLNEYRSTPIIINAINEILVDQYLKQKIPFNSFYKYILKVLNDRNYRKYAIRRPKDLEQINKINSWAKIKTLEKIESTYG